MMKFNNILLPYGVLACVAVILFGAAALLKPIKEKNTEQVQQIVMEALVPNSETFTEEAYEGDDENIVAVFRGETGCVVETKVDGYVDEMTLRIGVNQDGVVTGIMVCDMEETKGLGAQAVIDEQFLAQFLGTAGDITVGEDVDALSGATVSSKAVAKAVNSAVAFVTGADIESGATEWGG